MANAANEKTIYSSNKSPYTLKAYFNETETNIAGNYSKVYVEGRLVAGQYRWSSSYNSTLTVYWHDNNNNTDVYVSSTNAKEIARYGSIATSGTITAYHKSDGTLSGYAYVVWAKGGTSAFTPNNDSITTNWTALTNIPRNANITSANDFNDEQNPTIKYNNPGGFRINARLEFAGTNIRRDNISNTGSYTFDLTEAERKLLRQKCTGSSMIVRQVIATCIGGTAETGWSWLDKTMTIVNGNPTFSNFTFKDINPTTVALTGNNQNIVIGQSNIQAIVSTANKAIPKKEATISKYRLSIGNQSKDFNYSSSADVNGVINKVTNGTFSVFAIDSRNNSTEVKKLANKIINYTPLNKISIDVVRTNGVSEDTKLFLKGNIDLVNFGTKTNSIIYSQFRYKVAGTSTWSGYKSIKLNVSNNEFNFNGLIIGDTQKGFNINNSYQIEVLIKDELSEVTFTDTLGSGIPNIALAKNGVGLMGKYDDSVGGKGQISGNPIAYFTINSIYISESSENPQKLFGGSWEKKPNLNNYNVWKRIG